MNIIKIYPKKVISIMRCAVIAGTQQAHDVRTTLLRHHFTVLTLWQRPNNVVLTSCAGWVIVKTSYTVKIIKI